MNIVLVAIDDALADAWETFCGVFDCVRIQTGNIFEVECDAVVSPANSFGFMGGGIDKLYAQHFGPGVESRLQNAIRKRHHGELLVGAAEIVETGDSAIPYLIAAPTMRVPMRLNHSVNSYLAARAVLNLVKTGSFCDGPQAGQPIAQHVKTIAFPGLGTGIGGILPTSCAIQMQAAIDDVLLEIVDFPATIADAQLRHQQLARNWITDSQIEE